MYSSPTEDEDKGARRTLAPSRPYRGAFRIRADELERKKHGHEQREVEREKKKRLSAKINKRAAVCGRRNDGDDDDGPCGTRIIIRQ